MPTAQTLIDLSHREPLRTAAPRQGQGSGSGTPLSGRTTGTVGGDPQRRLRPRIRPCGMEFDRFTVALLVRRTDGPRPDPKTEDRLQDAHLAHLARLHDEGRLLAAGPLVGGPDRSIRGVGIFRGSPEELQTYAAADPWVQAGMLEYQFYPWIVPAGAVRFSRTKFPRSSAEAA